MRPWKSFIGSVSVLTLLTAGAFAAGSDVVPFSHASRTASPDVVVEDEAPAVDDDAPAVEPADEVVDEDITTTTDADIPDADTPDTDAPDTDADADTDDDTDVSPPVAIVDVPARPTPAAAPDVAEAPPAVPAENDAPAVCAAAAEAKCGPSDDRPSPATFESKVQRCQDWWNRLADRLDARGSDRWAERARRVAERCEAIAARWQEGHARKVKGDHNCDGHLDNGWHNKERPVCPVPAAPADRPARAPKPEKGDRPDTAPGQVRKNR